MKITGKPNQDHFDIEEFKTLLPHTTDTSCPKPSIKFLYRKPKPSLPPQPKGDGNQEIDHIQEQISILGAHSEAILKPSQANRCLNSQSPEALKSPLDPSLSENVALKKRILKTRPSLHAPKRSSLKAPQTHKFSPRSPSSHREERKESPCFLSPSTCLGTSPHQPDCCTGDIVAKNRHVRFSEQRKIIGVRGKLPHRVQKITGIKDCEKKRK